MYFKDWEIEEQIGNGSFGTVYRIKRECHGFVQYAAMKEIRIDKSNDFIFSKKEFDTPEEYNESLVRDILREVEMMDLVKDCPNIVRYEDHEAVKDEETGAWIIRIRMELLTPLRQYIKDRTLTKEEVIKVGTDLCNALEECEKHGIVHRDIKVDNVYVSDSGDFKLGDFGTAKVLEQTQTTYTRVGSMNYIAPEVLLGEKYDNRSDQYSLGVLLYYLLNNNSFPEIMSSGINTPPKNADKALSNAVIKACSRKKEKRFDSFSDFKKAIAHQKRIRIPVKPIIAAVLVFSIALSCVIFKDNIVSAFKKIPLISNLSASNDARLSSGVYNCLYYDEYKDYIDITGLKHTATSNVEIPEKISGKKVASIHSHAFRNCRITSLTIPSSVKAIGSCAFMDVSGLQTLSLPSGIEIIEKLAFAYAPDLSSVYIPSSVKEIDGRAFLDCPNLTAINVDQKNENYQSESGVLYSKNKKELISYPAGKSAESFIIDDSVEIIGDHSFHSNEQLQTISFGENVKKVGAFAFTGCSNLESVTFNSGLSVIEDSAFKFCNLLTTVVGGENINEIGEYAFYKTSFLHDCEDDYLVLGKCLVGYYGDDQTVNVPNGVETVSSIRNIESLNPSPTNIKFSDSVKRIQAHALDFCNLGEIIIPNTVTKIDEGAFYTIGFFSDPNELSVKISPDNPEYIMTDDGLIFSKDMTCLLYCPESYSEKIYVIPDTVTRIADYAFSRCRDIEFVTFNNNLKEIGNNAFESCGSLTSVSFSDSLVSIGESAFKSCSYLSSISFGMGLKSIGDEAFEYCNSYNKPPIEIVIPSSVESIGSEAFSNANIFAFRVDEASDYFKSEDGVLFNKSGTTLEAFPSKKQVAEYTVPDSVEFIDYGAFSNCEYLNKVDLNNAWMIAGMAFYFSESLQQINLDNVRVILDSAFSNCESLSVISLDSNNKMNDDIRFIAEGLFYGCESLKSLSLPLSLIRICESSFQNSGIERVELFSMVSVIESYSFEDTNIRTLNVPENCTVSPDWGKGTIVYYDSDGNTVSEDNNT